MFIFLKKNIMKINHLLTFVFCVLILSSCTTRLVDFTVISSKNVNLNIDKTKGKKVEGKKSYVFGIGLNIKDAMDIALESAGQEYDLLVDGVVRATGVFFITTVKVEGIAVVSETMEKSLGSLGYEEWLASQNLTYDKRNQVVNSEVEVLGNSN